MKTCEARKKRKTRKGQRHEGTHACKAHEHVKHVDT